jgi:transmembrane sensor
VAVVVGGGYLAWSAAGRSAPSEIASVAGDDLIVATGPAQIDSLFLADGTRVILGPGTTLSLAADFGATSREMTLQGEAMFDVLHDTTRPFLVKVPGGIVEDLGTAFSVRTGPDGAAHVVVTEGSVSLRRQVDAAADVVLYQGDKGSIPQSGMPAVERGTAVNDDLLWTQGILSFRDATVAEIDAELARWYGYRFRVEGSDLADRRLTATFRQEPAERIGEVIALAFGGRLEVQGETIVIHPAGLR